MGVGLVAVIDCLLSNSLMAARKHGYGGSLADTVRESAKPKGSVESTLLSGLRERCGRMSMGIFARAAVAPLDYRMRHVGRALLLARPSPSLPQGRQKHPQGRT
jgi:hypothetical protein